MNSEALKTVGQISFLFTYITLVWILQFKCLIFTINYIIHNIIDIHDPRGKKRAIGGAIKGKLLRNSLWFLVLKEIQ